MKTLKIGDVVALQDGLIAVVEGVSPRGYVHIIYGDLFWQSVFVHPSSLTKIGTL